MNQRETIRFRATADGKQGFGANPQQALEALMALLSSDASSPIISWPYNRGDAFFTEEQQIRLQELKSRRNSLTEAEQTELENLIEATIARMQALALAKS